MDVEIAFINETELTDAERVAIGALMPAVWDERYPGTHARAWCQQPPAYRLVAFAQGAAVANQSVFDLSVDEPVIGLGDLAVHPDFQQRGIARELVVLAVADLRERTDALIATSASKPHVRALFSALDFEAVPDGGFAFVEAPLPMNARDWMASRAVSLERPVRVTATC